MKLYDILRDIRTENRECFINHELFYDNVKCSNCGHIRSDHLFHLGYECLYDNAIKFNNLVFCGNLPFDLFFCYKP